jgi:hypothetical protein
MKAVNVQRFPIASSKVICRPDYMIRPKPDRESILGQIRAMKNMDVILISLRERAALFSARYVMRKMDQNYEINHMGTHYQVQRVDDV